MILSEYIKYRKEVRQFLSGSGNNNLSQINEDINEYICAELGVELFNQLDKEFKQNRTCSNNCSVICGE